MKDLSDFGFAGLEKMFSRRENREIQRLEQEVRRLRRLLQEVQERTANHIALLQQQLANRSQDVERLQAQLDSQQDYDQIQSELRTLRALTQTSDGLHCVSAFSPPSDVTRVSVENDPLIQTEVKTPEFHLLSERESSSGSFSVFVKAEPEELDLEVEKPDLELKEPDLQPEKIDLIEPNLELEELDLELEEPDLEPEESDLDLDTALLAQRVRETLQKSSVGQRVFGLCVLGLSQGTVSEILARPKPWSRLSPRGREPFIRMRRFLNDPHAIHTLTLAQDRLRDGGSDEAVRIILDQSRMESCVSLPEDADADRRVCDADRSEDVIRHILHQARQQMQESRFVPEPLTQVDYGPSGAQSPADFVQAVMRRVKIELDDDAPLQTDLQEEQPHSRPADALELDTARITQSIRETLALHNIGQRVFGEEVLGLTQSSVSELLSHPKPWSKLSLKGKENFMRMDLWLRDPNNVHKLNAKKIRDHRARLKRDFQRMSDAVGSAFRFGDLGQYEAMKRPRVVLGALEKETLLSAYRLEPYPSQNTIESLASQLGLMISTVSNWFYNYRSRTRRDGYSEPVQVRPAQSPARLSPASGILVKLEAGDHESDETTPVRRRDEHTHVSVGVQSVTRLKREKEDQPSFCSSF